MQAMKVVNMVKLKEEFDYESLCRKLETQVDHLSAEVDRQQKLRETDKHEMKNLLKKFDDSFAEAEKRFASRSEVFVSLLHIFFGKETEFYFNFKEQKSGDEVV